MPRKSVFFLGVLLTVGRLLGAAEVSVPQTKIELTAAERAWIAAHPVIRVGHDVSYEPYSIQDTNGQIVGIDPDYLELFSERTGLKFQNEKRSTWLQTIESFKAHELDLLPSLGHTVEREDYTLYSAPYAYAPNVIVTRNDTPFLFSLTDLKGRTVCIPRGYAGLRRDLNENAPDCVLVEYDSPLDCYKAVASGEAFASIGDLANAAYLIRSHQLNSLQLGSVLFNQMDNHFGVRKDWPELLSIINKAVASITKEDQQRISTRWITVDYAAGRWWITAAKVASGIAGAAILVFLFILVLNRRLARELEARRRIQNELELLRDELQQASREKSEFMHMVAHDLRSPLTGIQLGAELLQVDPPMSAEDLKSTVTRIRDAVGKMARLINDLLSAQNVEEGHFNLNFAPGEAGQTVRAAVAAARASALSKRIKLEATLPDQPVLLTTDFVALQQVVDNLLSNALKYSPPGSHVEITLAATATQCRFEVRDRGPGVKPEERQKIFEKYGRGSAQPTRGEGSTGLGLWIVQRFVTALHGRVWCESGPDGTGAVFVVEVPVAPPA